MSNRTAESSGTRTTSIYLLLFAAAFGAGDQYLGSRAASPWAVDTSLLAAPWLLLPFLIGCTQRSARRACVLATICVFAGLAGFTAMTVSPIEHAKISFAGVLGLVGWQVRWFLLAAVTAPLFGWLGHHWRTSRTLWPALIMAATFGVEAVARTTLVLPIHSSLVRWSEVGAAVALFVVCLVARLRPRVEKGP